MTNHTTAEKWLRNAPAGVRSVADSEGRNWTWCAGPLGGYAVCELLVDGMRTRDHLPPGTYTLNYREGLELNTEEAWDYLAGGEERRGNPCDDTDTQVKVVGESAFIRVAGVWDFTHNRKLNAKFYTIAPDEPAAECCCEARERVAELEGDVMALVQERDQLDRRVGEQHGELSDLASKNSDLEAKLAEAVVYSQNATDDYLRVIEEAQNATDERDKLRAELDAWRRVFLDEIPGDSDPNDATFWPAHWRNHEIETRGKLERLRAEVEWLKRDWWSVCQWLALDDENAHPGLVCATIDDLQHRAITLPADTTTPLDLAQRAVALMGGRVLRRHVPGGDITAPYYRDHRIGEAGENEICDSGGNTWYMANAHSLALLFCHTETVTLAPEPEPEPERRKLSFGEAVEELETNHELEFSAMVNGERLLLKWQYGTGVRPGGAIVVTASDYLQRITPAMLAAEWEECE